MLNLLKKQLGITKSPDGQSDDVPIHDDQASDKHYVIASFFYLLVIGLLGIPMWYHTCSITRHSLPDLTTLRTRLQLNSDENSPRVHLDISVVDLSRYDPSKTDDYSKYLSDPKTEYLRTNLQNFNLSFDSKTSYNLSWRIRRPLKRENELFNEYYSKNDRDHLDGLENSLAKLHKPTNKFRLFMYLIEDQYQNKFCEESGKGAFVMGFERFAFLCPPRLEDGEDFSRIASMIKSILGDIYVSSINRESTKHIRDGSLDLLLSIIPDHSNPSSLSDLSAIADLIHEIYQKHLGDNFPDMKELVNIRLIVQNVMGLIDTDLSERISGEVKQTNGTKTKLIKMDAFDALIREFDSRISKHSAQNVYNALLISTRHSPYGLAFEHNSVRSRFLQIKDSKSILLIDDDETIVHLLRSLIRSVVGLTKLSPRCLIKRDVFFNRWEIDALMGFLTLEKLYETLNSLSSIGEQVVGVKIPKEVADMAREADSLAIRSIERLRTKQTLEAYRLASRAYKISETAYYDPSLMESLYFPDELKYAIYLPLFLPLALPLTISIYRLLVYLIRRNESQNKQKLA